MIVIIRTAHNTLGNKKHHDILKKLFGIFRSLSVPKIFASLFVNKHFVQCIGLKPVALHKQEPAFADASLAASLVASGRNVLQARV